jgi:hypothetical protein
MTVKANSLHVKPDYTQHRKKLGAPALPDSIVSLDALIEVAGNKQAAINCRGWDTVRVLVALVGVAATADIQPLEYLEAENGFPNRTDNDRGFTLLGAATAGAVDGDVFSVTVNQCMLFLQITALANNPTDVRLFVAGETRANSPVEAR